MPTEPEEQLRILMRVSEEVIPEEEFLAKLRRARSEKRPLRVKYGMDPTAPDLHLGNAIALHKLALFQDLGHLPVIIVGDYTARVGDPSEANRTRPMLSDEEVEANARTYLDQVGLIVDLSRAEIRRNGEWFARMTFADVVRLASRATVAQMIERDDFTLRLDRGVPIGVHELLYPIMQGWDSVEVRADVEIGGTDQKFNLLFAREIQRAAGQEPQVVMTHALIEGSTARRRCRRAWATPSGSPRSRGRSSARRCRSPTRSWRSSCAIRRTSRRRRSRSSSIRSGPTRGTRRRRWPRRSSRATTRPRTRRRRRRSSAGSSPAARSRTRCPRSRSPPTRSRRAGSGSSSW